VNKAPLNSPSLDLMTFLLIAERRQSEVGWLELAATDYPDMTLNDYMDALKYIIGKARTLKISDRRERAIVYELQFWQRYDPMISPDVPISEVVKIFRQREQGHRPRDLH